jgi:hypothetical protein
MMQFCGFDGNVFRTEDITILKDALSFAEERMTEKPQRELRLYRYQGFFTVSWFDGEEWMGKDFLPSFMSKDSPSSK